MDRNLLAILAWPMNAARCVARSERAKYKEGVELLARLALFEHPPGPVIHRLCRPTTNKTRGERESIFSHFSRLHRDPNKPYRYEFLLPFTSLSSPSFLISVNFDKYIDPKVSTASETFVSKGAFFSSDFEFDLETGFPFLQSSYCIYIYKYIVRRISTRCISSESGSIRIKAKGATINNLPRTR